MEINRSNYEEFFLDYIEGNLPKESLAAFHAFLLQNKDLAEELEGFDLVDAPKTDISLGDTSFLKKPTNQFENQDVFNENCIALLEGDLNETDKETFSVYLNQFPKKKAEYTLFEKTKLSADLSIVFKNKKELKKGMLWVVSRKQIFTYSLAVGSIAACLVVLLGFYFRTNTAQQPVINFAQTEQPKESNKNGSQVNQKKDAISENHDLLAYTETTPPQKGSPVGKTVISSKNIPPKAHKSKFEQPTNFDKTKTEIVLPQNNSKMGIMYQLNGVQIISEKKKDDLTLNIQPTTQTHDSVKLNRFKQLVAYAKDRILPESLRDKDNIKMSDIAQSINKAAGEPVKVTHNVNEENRTEIYAINIAGYEFTRTKKMR